MVIGLCFNVKTNAPSTDPTAQTDAEYDAPETIAAIKAALISGGHKVIEIEADQECYLKLYKLQNRLDIVFNIAEGMYGDAREAQVPIFCDILEIPYTHSSALTNAIKLDKALTKKVLLYHGIRTPEFQLFSRPNEPINSHFQYPLLLKPNAEGSSKGILNANLVKNEKQLRERLRWLFKAFSQPVLVEEFLPGREFTVALLGNPPQTLPIIEQRLDRLPSNLQKFASYEVKWLWEDTLSDPRIAYDCPAKLNPDLEKEIQNISQDTFAALNCRDVARVDIRLDKNGKPHVLEINTMPGLIPGEDIISYFPIAARAAGYSYNSMLLAILEAASKRYHLTKK